MKKIQLTVAAIAMGMFCAGCSEKSGAASADKSTAVRESGVAAKTEESQEAAARNEPITLDQYTVSTKFVDQGYQGEAFKKYDKGTHSIYVCERHGVPIFLVGVNPEGMIFIVSKMYEGSELLITVKAFTHKYDLRFETAQRDNRIISASAKRGDIRIDIEDMGMVKVEIYSDSLLKTIKAELQKIDSDAEKKAVSDFKF